MPKRDRFDYGENRFITLGLLNGIVLVVVHIETDTIIRVISARKATKNEEKSYFKEIADRLESRQGDERQRH